jgi:hypothetical protein
MLVECLRRRPEMHTHPAQARGLAIENVCLMCEHIYEPCLLDANVEVLPCQL